MLYNFTLVRLSPAEYAEHFKNNKIIISYFNSPAGVLQVQFTQLGILKMHFVDPKTVPADALSTAGFLDKKLIVVGTDFQIKVWQATLAIPAGSTKSYQEIAQLINAPGASRAVGTALGKNQIAYLIPCHRVICSSGSLGGYAGGLDKKRLLLEHEKNILS